MTAREAMPAAIDIKQALTSDPDFLRPMVQVLGQEALEAEMTAALGAAKGERTTGRLGYRSGYYERGLVTRVGKLELRVPQSLPCGRRSRIGGIARAASRPSCSSAISAARRPWWQPLSRCTCRACRRAR
jgi:hypothetical protein